MSLYCAAKLTVSKEIAKATYEHLSQRFPEVRELGQTWHKIPEQVAQDPVRCLMRWNAKQNSIAYDLTPVSGSRFLRKSAQDLREELGAKILDPWFQTQCHAYQARQALEKQGFKVTENWDEATQIPVLVGERADGPSAVSPASPIGDFQV